ncbi:MAG TPA: MBL fold metallo-hydrolase [Burkholderiales bacterium]|nr:MBL fold metallo-hydrolase [Burkholderiales bacterium]
MTNSSISVGDIRLTIVSGGQLWIDGGNMFGVIPRVLWQQKSPPDELNRIRLDTNCVLVRTRDSLGLVDTGYGGKLPHKLRQRHGLDDGAPLVRNLAAAGVTPEQIDWVILTHLHFDHAGGATDRDEDGAVRPTFPRARHYVQRFEWEDALAVLPELAGAYSLDDFVPIERAGLLEIVEGDAQIVPGITTQLTGAHTRGHQIVRIESEDESATCLADICPTAAHLPTFWTMAYDQLPLAVRRIKPRILNDIAEQHRIALFSHDPQVVAARLAPDASGELSIVELVRAQQRS